MFARARDRRHLVAVAPSCYSSVSYRQMLLRIRELSESIAAWSKHKRLRCAQPFMFDPCENRTRVTAVKGRCLSRLTNGP